MVILNILAGKLQSGCHILVTEQRFTSLISNGGFISILLSISHKFHDDILGFLKTSFCTLWFAFRDNVLGQKDLDRWQLVCISTTFRLFSHDLGKDPKYIILLLSI